MADPTASADLLSVVVPVFNEAENLRDLHRELTSCLNATGSAYEILMVDDGSSDGGLAVLEELGQQDPALRVVVFRRNFGQTAALAAGIAHARGNVVITIDADLQNDPADIPRLLEVLRKGADVASGCRARRQDAWLTRKVPSWFANRLISWVTGVSLRDYGCTLKAYRGEVLKDVHLYGEMHRFLPAVVSWRGAKVVEVDVNHRPRTRGVSKYGLGRILRVLLDLVTVKFLGSYASKPIHFFGAFGLAALFAGVVVISILTYMKFARGWSMITSPLLLLSALFVIIGFQSILMGLLAELSMRTYYEAQRKPPYVVRRFINMDGTPCAGSRE